MVELLYMKKYPQYKMIDKSGSREAPRMPEVSPVPEIKPEIKPEVLPTEKEEQTPPPSTPPPAVQPKIVVPSKEPVLAEIESILSAGLLDVYKGLSPELQKEFKQEGERVAGRIREMLARAQVHVRKILQMIRAWLKIIPGVNKFFLEQEAKIKTDKIIELAKREK